MLNRILGWSRAAKRVVVVAMDVCLGLVAMWLAFTLRLETPHWPEGMQWLAYALAPALAFPIFAKLGLYRAIFRYTGITALITTGKAVAIYGALLLGCLLAAQWEGVPRSVGVLQPLLFMLLVGSSRALGWLALAGHSSHAPYRLLIYGAGSAGAQTAAGLGAMRQYVLKGFVDDDPSKVGRSINGVRVHSPTALPEVARRLAITDVLLALPSTTRLRRRQIIESLRQLPVRIRTLPGLSDLASGRVTVTDFQDLEIEDLLGREPVAPDPGLLGRDLESAVVMVTGAGGSIGSELCRQIVREGPRQLLLVDHSEYALYSIHHELQALAHQGAHQCALVPLLASVNQKQRMDDICQQYSPTSIYHAAAYKHVPMVEANPGEGILNNVFGTLNMVQVALKHGARHFVLISTDKAVRPTNIMGATKRVAEMVLQAVAASQRMPFGLSAESPPGWRCPTRLSMVRFGNVLGSSGSVIPLFRQQIAAGGPLTVTHPDVTRYFMTIAEAAQLVLQAGTMADGGDVFLLDMGEPLQILDLAQRMVALSGLTVRDDQHPEGDIEIVFTGLRPGEKLFEELLIGDNPLPTVHPRILRAREEFRPWAELQALLQSLQQAARDGDRAAMTALLGQLVPGYRPETQALP
ncbi:MULTISPECIES: nucleoside-diphosphate sugar epimerase/dehydratase [unclassified Acidovorax]|uniref:polysaccharide biosynthesis protein n=1 Tax=unclassified Acidovorax TaxID=2684926 RepID=UPI001C474A6D|nr:MULTISPECIES: nucleoside-diphosphate sugar epimerase/dehydratase [unclassified Acidovorax]MBV7427625.1 polysaccharide biosynthesis protein [Acidovorax sp. sif0732]MBV7449985.1 polysaccharide biosynthesis protein [Acidovorax sp. sif0715]